MESIPTRLVKLTRRQTESQKRLTLRTIPYEHMKLIMKGLTSIIWNEKPSMTDKGG